MFGFIVALEKDLARDSHSFQNVFHSTRVAGPTLFASHDATPSTAHRSTGNFDGSVIATRNSMRDQSNSAIEQKSAVADASPQDAQISPNSVSSTSRRVLDLRRQLVGQLFFEQGWFPSGTYSMFRLLYQIQ